MRFSALHKENDQSGRDKQTGDVQERLVSVLKAVNGILGTEAKVLPGCEEMTSASLERVDKTSAGPHVNDVSNS